MHFCDCCGCQPCCCQPKKPINLCGCDCSGFVRVQDSGRALSANICPHCKCDHGVVDYTNTPDQFTFYSIIVKPASCISNGGSRVLVTSGEGTIQTPSGRFPAAFHLTLVERVNSTDTAFIRIFWLGNTGTLHDELFSFNNIPENHLQIVECPDL